jgi:hypothetical protein
MKKAYERERAEEILRIANRYSVGFFTDEKTYNLPEPIKKYLKDKVFKKKFSAVVDNYQIVEDIKMPKEVRIVWHLDTGDYEYYKGTIENIIFDVSQ